MRIVILQSRQPLTINPTEIFDDVVILTDDPSRPVIREDVIGSPPRVIRSPRESWADVVTSILEGSTGEVITNDEYCLQICSELRMSLNQSPRHPTNLVSYLDKVEMKTRLRQCGVATPRFVAIDAGRNSTPSAAEILLELGSPVVAKPRQEANSRGIEVLADKESVAAWLEKRKGGGWEIEQYIAGTQYHVDGIVHDGKVLPVIVGKYFGPLLGLPRGRKLGGISLDFDDPIVEQANHLNRAVVDALGADGDFVVHTEFVVDFRGELVVLESAARAPGAMLPELARRCSDVQLERANFELQLGIPTKEVRCTKEHAAWIWIPVMPGERITAPPSIQSSHLLEIRRLGRHGNQTRSGGVGAAITIWSDDRGVLMKDVDIAMSADWSGDSL